MSTINQLCAPGKESETCYSNASHQILQTHLFVSTRRQLEEKLHRELLPAELSELKESLRLMPLYTWLKGNREHRSKPYPGVSFDHLQNIRRELSLMKESGIPGLDFPSGVILAAHLFGYDPLVAKGENPYNAPPFPACIDRARPWFGEHVLAANQEHSFRAMYDILESYIKAKPELRAEFPDYNVYAFEDKSPDGNKRQFDEIAIKVRNILSHDPHYPLAFGAAGHYVTITGIQESCCKRHESNEFSCEDLWQVKNSYGDENSGLFSSRVLAEKFMNLVFIKPCGQNGKEKCMPEIQEISKPLEYLLEMEHPPSLTEEDFERIGLAQLESPNQLGSTAIETAIAKGNLQFAQVAIRYLIKHNLFEHFMRSKRKIPDYSVQKVDLAGEPIYQFKETEETMGRFIERSITTEVNPELNKLVREINGKTP